MSTLKVVIDENTIIGAKVRALQTRTTLAKLVDQAILYYLAQTAIEVGVSGSAPVAAVPGKAKKAKGPKRVGKVL
jgi:hypothetical protein